MVKNKMGVGFTENKEVYGRRKRRHSFVILVAKELIGKIPLIWWVGY